MVDGDQEGGDALAYRMPCRLADGDDEHVALVHARQIGRIAQATWMWRRVNSFMRPCGLR